MKSRLYLLTLAGLSTSLCFAAVRVTMHNSPKKRSQLNPQPNTTSSPKPIQVTTDKKANREELETLVHSVAQIEKTINNLKKTGAVYAQADLNELGEQLGTINLKLEDINTSAPEDLKLWSEVSASTLENIAVLKNLRQTFNRNFGALPPLKRSRSLSPRNLPQFSDEFRGTRVNQVKITPPETPARATAPVCQKHLTSILRTPQKEEPAPQPKSDSLELSSLFKEFHTNTNPFPEANALSLPHSQNDLIHKPLTQMTCVTEQSNPQPARSFLRLPLFMKKHWKLLTVCGLILTGVIINHRTKYKFLTRFAHLFTK